MLPDPNEGAAALRSDTDRLLPLREVEFRTSLKKSTLYALRDFPRPVKLASRRSAWLASEIQAWIESRASKRGA
jgi:predicted DNA-binding transcriptional regulator AlpA